MSLCARNMKFGRTLDLQQQTKTMFSLVGLVPASTPSQDPPCRRFWRHYRMSDFVQFGVWHRILPGRGRAHDNQESEPKHWHNLFAFTEEYEVRNSTYMMTFTITVRSVLWISGDEHLLPTLPGSCSLDVQTRSIFLTDKPKDSSRLIISTEEQHIGACESRLTD